MTNHFNKRAQQSKPPEDCMVSPEALDAMTPAELAEAMERALDAMTEETYDPALIDAYLDALDRKTPVPEVPDAQSAFSRFQRRVLDTFPESRISTKKPTTHLRKLWRVLLTAAVLAACLLGCMVAAQAAGMDVFGAMVRWSNEVFSFGTIRQTPEEAVPQESDARNLDERSFSSLQEALDTYEITEITAPTWIPDGYELERIDITDLDEPEILTIFASYVTPDDSLGIFISSYTDEPFAQVEKIDKPPEIFEAKGQIFYMLENEENCMVAWVTDHFECYVDGALDRKDALREMAYSMFD